MRSTPHAAALALAPALALLAASPAAALVIAQNDSLDASELAQPSSVPMCPCFCSFECFGSTFTAPDDLQTNYIYLLYGAQISVNLAVDVEIRGNPTDFDPGEPFTYQVGEKELETVLTYFPIAIGTATFFEIDVTASKVQPVTIPAGDDFAITVCFNYDTEEGVDPVEPESGHGPVWDMDGAQGTQWIRSFTSYPPCGAWGDPQIWLSDFGAAGDFVIRVTDEPVDWLAQGDDDDDDATGDDDDDDDGDDDDDDGVPVVTGITPSSAVEGEAVDVAITGSGFADPAQVFIGGLAASDVRFVSAERVDARSPESLTAEDSPYDVVLNSAGQTSTLPGAFSVAEPEGGCGCEERFGAGAGAGAAGAPARNASGLTLAIASTLLILLRGQNARRSVRCASAPSARSPSP